MIKRILLLSVIFYLSIGWVISQPSFRLPTYNGIIGKITLQGIFFSDLSLVYSTIRSIPGQQLSTTQVASDITNLYSIGSFNNINVNIKEIEATKYEIIFVFQEKKLIKDIVFIGNEQFDVEDFEEELKTKKGNFVNRQILKTDIQTITQKYKQEGYLKTQVLYKIEDIEGNFKRVIFDIIEEPRIYLVDIKIEGTEFFDEVDIIRRMQSAAIDCFSWITDGGIYNNEKINQDLQTIFRAYLEEGFFRVYIHRPRIKIIHNKDVIRAEVSFRIDEGEQYYINSVSIKSLDEYPLLYSEKELTEKLTLKQGALFNVLQEGKERATLLELYYEAGYAFADIQIGRKIDDEKKKVDLLYSIKRNEKTYINRVEFSGNKSTLDYVLRREMTIHDNELFNNIKLRESLENLQKLGFFEAQTGVNVQYDRDKEKSLIDINIDVKEANTGNFIGGLAYSDIEKFSLNLSVSKANFLGKGQRISASVNISSNQQQLDLSFTEPYFLDTKVSSYSRVFQRLNQNTGLGYDQQDIGGEQQFSFDIWKKWKYSIRYGYTYTEYLNIDSNGDDTLNGERNDLFSSLRNSINYSSVNNPYFPTDGIDFGITEEEVGGFLGGSRVYRSLSLSYEHFYSLTSTGRTVLMANFLWSRLFEKDGQQIPVSTRYTLGGISSLRGFAHREIAGPSSPVEWAEDFNPSDLNVATSDSYNPDDYEYYNNHVRGNERQLLNIELLFPLTKEGLNIRGVAFFDIGNVFAERKLYDIVGAEYDRTYYRMSYGYGVRFITPVGVLRFENGIKINPKPGESKSRFEFTVGTLF